MRARHVLTIAAVLLATAACKPEPADAGSISDAGATDSAITNDAARVDDGSVATQPAAAPGGAFARKPGFQLPVPVSTTPMGANSVPQSRQVDPVGIQTALIEGMEESGADIRVQVSPSGMVSLSGEVASVAEAQRAHYLARAQPGVVEVDYRNLRVRQR